MKPIPTILPLYAALQKALGNVNGTELTVHMSDEECHILTKEKADVMYETVLYRVGPLGMTGEKLDEFVSMLEQETCGPWDCDEPGTGTISGIQPRSILAVRQVQRVQREILEILRGLRPRPTVRSTPTAKPVIRPVAVVVPVTPAREPDVQAAAPPPTTPRPEGSLAPSDRQPIASETWEGIGVYAPLLLALLVGCLAGYLGRN